MNNGIAPSDSSTELTCFHVKTVRTLGIREYFALDRESFSPVNGVVHDYYSGFL